MTAIYRYEVPVDDQWHTIELAYDPISVGCRQLTVVEFWALADDRPWNAHPLRKFMVVGTGHPLPGRVRVWGTAVAPGGQLVWHLVEQWDAES